MKALSKFPSIYLCTRPVDFRRYIDGLASIVEADLGGGVFGGVLFVFTNKSRDKIKMIYWDRTGFAMWLKRLEKGKFSWPKHVEEAKLEVASRELDWLLEGINVWKLKPHETLTFTRI